MEYGCRKQRDLFLFCGLTCIIINSLWRRFYIFDPQYDSNTTTFNSYIEEGFNKNEQIILARVFKELSDRGCYVMLSNHNTMLVNELYKDYHIYLIKTKRSINSNSKKRGNVKEVIITNYTNNKTF